MALATNTTEGDIALAGDLNGAINSPTLTTTGVVPNTYLNAKIVVDAKGRTIYAEAMTDQEVSDELDLVLTNPLPVQDATDSIKGYVQVDDNGQLSIDLGVLSMDTYPEATTSSKGIIKINNSTGLSIGAGVLSVDSASSLDLGVVMTNDASKITIVAGMMGVGVDLILLDVNNTMPTQSESGFFTTNDTLIPDFINYTNFTIDNSSSIITISNPTIIPPKGNKFFIKIINSNYLILDTDFLSNNERGVLVGVNILLLESTGVKIKASLITDFPT